MVLTPVIELYEGKSLRTGKKARTEQVGCATSDPNATRDDRGDLPGCSMIPEAEQEVRLITQPAALCICSPEHYAELSAHICLRTWNLFLKTCVITININSCFVCHEYLMSSCKLKARSAVCSQPTKLACGKWWSFEVLQCLLCRSLRSDQHLKDKSTRCVCIPQQCSQCSLH